MSEITKMSMIDLYEEVRYINDQLTTDDRMQPLSWERVKGLQDRKKELFEEIKRRDNECYRQGLLVEV